MKRWIYFLLCAIFGLALLLAGWLTPIYLRAVDAAVLQRAGQNTPSVTERGLSLVREANTGAAELLLQAAQQENISNHQNLREAIVGSLEWDPEQRILGTDPRSEALLELAQNSSDEKSDATTPFTALMIQSGNRAKALNDLRQSPNSVVQQLLQCRALTNTVLFPPSQSSSGQAFDAALFTTGLLLGEGQLTRALVDDISANVASALRGESSQPFEQILLDLMSLGQRFDWGQLVIFCEQIEDAETLRLLATLARQEDAQLPVLFSAVQLSGKPASVAKYLMTFSESGPKDLATSLRFGAGGVTELLKRNQRLHHSSVQGKLNAFSDVFVYLPWQMPRLALGLKWFLYLSAGFLLALGLHFAHPQTPAIERPFHVRGFHLAREILFALGFLLVVLLFSEPFLAQGNQNVEFPLRLQLPTMGSAAPTENAGAQGITMNHLSLFTLLLFFVLQGLIYIACLVKLAEIRRQTFTPRMKLKLLENEDNMFDAGLYLGFAGTIISLILVSTGVIKPSLMAAYSSTAFGVIFVSIFKIFHLRPLRRKLLLDAEAAEIEAQRTENAFPASL